MANHSSHIEYSAIQHFIIQHFIIQHYIIQISLSTLIHSLVRYGGSTPLYEGFSFTTTPFSFMYI